jgi:hypothetical protein
MMAYLMRPAQEAKLVDDLEPGSLKDELLKDFDPSQETYEEYLRRKSMRENAAQGGVIGGGTIKGEDLGSRTGFDRPLKTGGPSSYIREVLGKLPKGGRFDAEALAKDIIKKFPDSSKSFIDKRDGSVSTSTIYKVVQKDKSLIPLKLKPYNQVEKTIIRVQNFIDDFIKTNERNPTVGEVKVGAQTDPTQLTKYKEAGKITGMQDTVFDAHKIAIDYLNSAEKPTIKGLQKLIGNAPVKNAETLLSNMYLRTLEAMRNRAAGIEQTRSVYKDFSIKELDALKRKVRAVPGYKDIYSRQIEDLVSEAYKNQPKKLKTALKKIGKYKKLNEELRKIGAGLQLDHPLSYDFLKKAKGGASPEELIRVTPIPERVNTFKKSLDEKLIEISKGLKKNPGDKKVLGLYQDIQSISSEIGVKVGKISKAGNIISAQAAKAGDVPLLPDVKKGAAIQNAFREFVKGIKNDPRIKNLGINVKELADLAKAKAVDSTEYLKVVDNFVAKAGKFGIPLAGAYTVYKVAGFDQSALADDLPPGVLPQGSPGQINPETEEGFSTGEKLAGAGAAAGTAYKFGKPILKTAAAIARPFSIPSVAAGFGLGQFVDVNPFKFASDEEREAGKSFITRDEKFGSLKEDPSFALAGADLLYPEIAKQTVGKFVKPTGKGILSMLGRAAMNPFGKLVRGFTPVGIGLQGVELVNQARKEQDRINEMRMNDPDQYQEYLDELESYGDFSA